MAFYFLSTIAISILFSVKVKRKEHKLGFYVKDVLIVAFIVFLSPLVLSS